jgi:Type I restriction-modification system methyltransferase subunit
MSSNVFCPREGYLIDFISGEEVIATPEEVDAVQVFLKILVNDYGYPKEHISAHPQFRVKANPSDTKYKFPVDITIFSSSEKKRDDAYIVVECKKKDRKDGFEQLKHYLEFSNAYIGVWFNGNEKLYVHKYFRDGKIYFDELINIPKYQQRLEDIGHFCRKDLISTHNLKQIFSSLRNYLAGNAVGTTRDEELAKQLINIILCKLYDEKYTRPDDIVKFRAGINEKVSDISIRIKNLFVEAKTVYSDVLSAEDNINLDDKSIAYVVGELQNYCLMTAERDVIGDAFEVFVHGSLKGGQGQFFTPKNVVKTAIQILDPGINDKIIDPACGSGGFLIEALKYVHNKIELTGLDYSWSDEAIDAEKRATVNVNLKGLEKDSFLCKVAKAYMVVMGDGKSGIFCEDSLNIPDEWGINTQSQIQLGAFDIVVTNPPFGSKIPVGGSHKLSQYDLGHKWEDKSGTLVKKGLKANEAPQILFIERCLQLLKNGGKLAIVLPDGVLSNPTDSYIVKYILMHAELIGIIDLPMSTFLPYTPTKTHLVFFKKTTSPRQSYSFFMSYAKTCGHDKRGRQINDDEIIKIPEFVKNNYHITQPSHLGFSMPRDSLENSILLPKYYNPELVIELEKYSQSGQFKLESIQNLIKNDVIKISRGHEVGSDVYGTGDYPFIRTSEISNWEITVDPTHCVSRDVYEEYKSKQNLQNEDVIVINDGTYLMGRSAMLTDLDLEIVLQSHFRIIRVLNKDLLSPYVLLALLGLEIVQKQIEAKCFRQGTISTLGSRLSEIVLPIPTDLEIINKLDSDVRDVISKKRESRIIAQNYEVLNKNENMMGIKNKGKLGNL